MKTMSLAAIAAMFVPGSTWEASYDPPRAPDRTYPQRRVRARRSGDIVWDVGNLNGFYTAIPKAGEVVDCADGLLVMRYETLNQLITYRRVDDAELSRQIHAQLDAMGAEAKLAKAADDARKEREKARQEAEYREAIHAKILAGTDVHPRDLIDACSGLGISVPIQTRGAMLRKTTAIGPSSYSYRTGKLPRFSRGHCPTQYYRRAQDTLRSAEPEDEDDADGLTPDELNHLFGAPSKEVPAATLITPQAAALARLSTAFA